MEKYNKKNIMLGKFVKYMQRTWVNKVIVLTMLGFAYFAAKLTGDATAFAFMLVLFGPLFFVNKNCFNF